MTLYLVVKVKDGTVWGEYSSQVVAESKARELEEVTGLVFYVKAEEIP